VRLEIELARSLDDGERVGPRKDPAAGPVVRVLDRDERRARVVVSARLDRGLHLRDAEEPPLAGDRELNARKGGTRARLEPREVCPFAAHDLVASPRARQQGELVAHRAGGDEKGRLLAREARHELFQGAHGGVFAVDVVADLGARHGFAHGRCGARDGVRPQIDHAPSYPRWSRCAREGTRS
jgi:hypothetical protein